MTRLRGWTLRECRASSAESRTFDEWAPSLSESRMEYSLSDLPRPWFRSYSSNLQIGGGQNSDGVLPAGGLHQDARHVRYVRLHNDEVGEEVSVNSVR